MSSQLSFQSKEFYFLLNIIVNSRYRQLFQSKEFDLVLHIVKRYKKQLLQWQTTPQQLAAAGCSSYRQSTHRKQAGGEAPLSIYTAPLSRIRPITICQYQCTLCQCSSTIKTRGSDQQSTIKSFVFSFAFYSQSWSFTQLIGRRCFSTTQLSFLLSQCHCAISAGPSKYST